MLELLTFENGLALLTLTVLEIVLGIDNIIFIAILTNRLPQQQQEKARVVGLALAMFARIGLLFAISWVMRLTTPLFEMMGHDISWRSLILIGGGAFLIAKATMEIHHKLEEPDKNAHQAKKVGGTFFSVIVQILLLDIIFSLDSVITAVGMVKEITVMVVAIVVAVGVMMLFAGKISRFIEGHPTMKMLALAFLVLVGVVLVAEGLGQHINKGYIYFAMAFSFGVEMLNMKIRGGHTSSSVA
jgi:predicted tellurium resistance membrane protein TerC